MRIISLLFLFLTFKSYSQQTFAGMYYRPTKGGGCTIQINKDSTYSQKMGDCTWGFNTKGKWTANNDTVYLHADKLYSRSGKRLPLTTSTPATKFEIYQNMNKLLLKNDTLFIAYKGRLRYPMPKENSAIAPH